VAAAAAAILLVVAGVVAEHVRLTRDRSAVDSRPRYALLLYGDRGGDAAVERTLVEEYGRWARTVAARGHYVAGEKLTDEATELRGAGLARPIPLDAGFLVGFFIISAATPAEAESIARTCPHLRYGGRIVVRPIEPT
jgi:hypothetical protein